MCCRSISRNIIKSPPFNNKVITLQLQLDADSKTKLKNILIFCGFVCQLLTIPNLYDKLWYAIIICQPHCYKYFPEITDSSVSLECEHKSLGNLKKNNFN